MFKYSLFVLFVIAYSRVAYSQLAVGDKCFLQSTRRKGLCSFFNDCKNARVDFQSSRILPELCGFQESEPIVCCENSRQPGVISKEKCREYSSLVYEKRRSPVLLIDPYQIVKNECGHKVVKLIIGGEKATRKEFPHMAVIGYEPRPGEISWLCGGTIISSKFILTAGHCLWSKDFKSAIYVKIGITNLNDTSRKRQQIRIAERIPHPEYKYNSYYHDIGLLRLERPAEMNSYARPACLSLNDNIPSKKVMATGWGNTDFADGVGSDDLLKVTLNLIDYDDCNNFFKSRSSRKFDKGVLNDIQMCAGSTELKDTCQGDSGGPLQIYHTGDDVECMYDIVGVTSFGTPCSGRAAIYTRVSNYIQWIENIVWP